VAAAQVQAGCQAPLLLPPAVAKLFASARPIVLDDSIDLQPVFAG